jgi:hypothetical protein
MPTSGKSTAYSRMPDDLLEAVAHAAAKNERSMSAELRTLVREGLQARAQRQPADAA